MSIIKSIQRNHFDMKEKRGWDKTFWFFDIHATMIKPNYQMGNIPTEFYPYALETLQMISKLDDVCMILYTCSHPHEIKQYMEYFESNDVKFIHINKNPEISTDLGSYGCYDDKPYINVLFDDKAGFDGETDWLKVKKFLEFKYGKTIYKGLDDENVEQLGGEIDNEGLGYWVENYTRDWIKGEFDYELTVLLEEAEYSMSALSRYLYRNNIMD